MMTDDKSDRRRLFNELSVSKLKLRAGEPSQVVYRDKKQDGLLLRLNKNSKAWRVQFYDHTQGKMRTEAIGIWKPGAPDHVPLKDARDKAANFKSNKKKIIAERAQKALANRDSFKAVSEWYIKKFVDGGNLRSAHQIKAMINAILPEWQDDAFEAITRSDVMKLLDNIAEDRGPRAADVTLTILRKMMGEHAVRSDTYSSPIVKGMAHIKDPRKRARDRILDDREIRLMFAACDRLGTAGNLCKALLYTAQRIGKVATMKFDDVEDGLWTIATESREKGNAQRLKLPKPVLDIIAAQAELRMNEFVFPAGRVVNKTNKPGEFYGSFSAFGAAKVDIDSAMMEIEPKPAIPHWIFHDLRRTSKSLMARAGIRPDISERVLGHTIKGVEFVYDRHSYDTEREAALIALATLIEAILHPPTKGGNVVSISRR